MLAWALVAIAALSVLLGAANPALAQPAASAAAQGSNGPKVRLATTAGDIVIELDREKAPKTVDNFLHYVKSGHYDGTIFHRVISGFMIQGGGYKADLSEKPTRAPIALESRKGLSNERGTIAMARTGMPDSATSQFFINVADNTMLDQPNARDGNGYAVFGRVVDGMEVVDKIREVATVANGPHQNLPAKPITIRKATLEK
ncbi:MAG: peptidylprolyl isomerase [Rubrivivax sp.]